MAKKPTIKTLKRNNKNYPLFTDKVIWVLLLVFVQLWFIIISFLSLREKYIAVQSIASLVSLIIVLYIINRPINPAYKLAWCITILFIPVFGGLLYLLFSVNATRRKFRKSIRKAVADAKLYLAQNDNVMKRIQHISKHAAPQASYIHNATQYPVYDNTAVTYFSSGEELYFTLIEELKQAKHFIFMEYFIIHEGVFWDSVLTVLKEKAREGVDVRVIYDDMGSLSTLPRDYHLILQEYGIKSYPFNPCHPLLSLRLNNRDHRKITVIDGHTSFTGGINLADEYINQQDMNGYWKDTGIMMKGDATWNMTNMFLQMWQHLSGETVDFEMYHVPPSEFPFVIQNDDLPENPEETANNKPIISCNGFVQPYADNPLFSEIVAENVYLNMIHRATKYIYITTPYLIVDNEMITALTLAARSGIDVRIVTPGIPDKKAVFMMTRSFYEPLTKAGVKIYEYTPGFVHAKMMVVDDVYAVVGSINLDFRSLYLHFECAAFLYHSTVIEEIKDDIEEAIAQSQKITYEYCISLNNPYRLWQSLLRLYTPLL